MERAGGRELFEARWGAIRVASLRAVGPSWAERLAMQIARLPESQWDSAIARAVDAPIDGMHALHDWEGWWARPKQVAPAWGWDVWLLLGGRGSGKTRPASEFVDEKVRTGAWRTFALVGPDYPHVVKYMLGGEKGKDRNGSGLLDIARPWCRPTFIYSQLEVRYPNGAVGHIVTADKPEFRGPNLDGAWCDEPTKWRYADRFIQNLELTLRDRAIGARARPQVVYSSNPARLAFLLRLIMDETTHVTHMTTWENANNLADAALAKWKRTLGGTADGARELEGEVDFFGDDSKKVFPLSDIDAHRVDEAPALDRIAVAVDPGASTKATSDPTGIIAGGVDERGHVYILADDTEPRPPKRKPEDWADSALALAVRLGASEALGETNKGGDMVAATLRAAIARLRARGRRAPELAIKEVYSVGDKASRAAPVRVLYRTGAVHHVGRFAELEDEQTTWEPGMPSPNRLDALVMLIRALRPDIMEDGPEVGATEIGDALKATREIQREPRTGMEPGAVGWGNAGSGGGGEWSL